MILAYIIGAACTAFLCGIVLSGQEERAAFWHGFFISILWPATIPIIALMSLGSVVRGE